jgi:predicted nucleic acid-binding Zn ribbon protein
MERAARLVNKHKYSQDILEEGDVVRGIWPAAVGAAIARHTGKLKVVRETLVVEVEDAIWQKQLHCLRSQIVDRVQKCMGSPAIKFVEFRIGVRRREPQKETGLRAESVDPNDEAEGIQDPVLKKVYQLSRKRSTA